MNIIYWPKKFLPLVNLKTGFKKARSTFENMVKIKRQSMLNPHGRQRKIKLFLVYIFDVKENISYEFLYD